MTDKKELEPINSGHYHEVIDRIHIIACQLEEFVFKSIPGDHNPKLREKLDEAFKTLGQAYTIAAEAMMELEDAEQAKLEEEIITKYLISLNGEPL